MVGGLKTGQKSEWDAAGRRLVVGFCASAGCKAAGIEKGVSRRAACRLQEWTVCLGAVGVDSNSTWKGVGDGAGGRMNAPNQAAGAKEVGSDHGWLLWYS